MKTLLLTLIALSSPLAMAETVNSEGTQVEIARVVQVVNLVKKDNILVNVAVQDHGGATDVSPTQTVFLTLYRKGEWFNVDATFKIADVLSFKGARRVSGGIYEVVVGVYDEEGLRDVTYQIDARRAVTEIQRVNCGNDFDCDAALNFRSSVEVNPVR